MAPDHRKLVSTGSAALHSAGAFRLGLFLQMRLLLRFARLSRADQILMVRAAMALAFCQVRLRIQDVAHLRKWATSRRHGDISVDKLIAAVERVSRILPGTTCLVRAIALQHLLSLNDHDSELSIGVGKSNGHFSAHAWLAQRGRILIGAAEAANYKLLDVWPSVGQNARHGGDDEHAR